MEIAQLQARVDELEEENRQLKDQLLDVTWEPPLEIGLTGKEAALIAILMKQKGVVSKESLLGTMYQLMTDDPPELKIIDVFVCKARKKLRPYGLEIATVWGRGYELPEATKALLRNWA